MTRRFEPQEVRREFKDRAVLVAADLGAGEWSVQESLAELERLVETAGADVVATVTQRLERPNPKTFIGQGKAEEVARVAKELEATLVVFDDDLSPRQQANLEDIMTGVKLVDRTALILDIFAIHATSREGKLQVELAQMEYLLPRLRGLWRHLERTGGGGLGAAGTGGVGTRGPGETQLETDRRLARKRIGDLRRELKQVSSSRVTQRARRAVSGVFRVTLVGYTNAGKSTLLNSLTGAGALEADMLFATLDSTTRSLELPEGRLVTLTDTVGFIKRLPHGLVEAFKSTLDEVREADLLLHVVDASHGQRGAQMRAVREVLGEIGAGETPQLVVYNKTDAVPPEEVAALRRRRPDAGFVSARTGEGLQELLQRIGSEASKGSRTMTLLIPYTRGDMVRAAHERTQVVSERHTESGTEMMVRAPSMMVDALEPFETTGDGGD